MTSESMLAWAVVFATFAGPILAVFVTRWVDDHRSKQARKLDTFRVLIRTRRTQLSQDFVTALNMVEIDYYDAPKVINIHSELMRHLNSRALDDGWLDRTQRLVARLLNAMGQNVGYSLEQLDILEGGYLPQALVDVEAEQQQVRKSLLAMFNGKPLPVSFQVPPRQMPQPPQYPLIHDVPPPT